ncbi:hypothetical protein FRC05_007324, partial [Tulasnella sp. 425]
NNPQPQTAKTINFAEKYVAPPQVAVGLNFLDIKSGTVLRAKGYADGIDAQRCTMHADTWADTTLYMAGMDFLIKKPGDLDMQIGEFNTEEDHPLGQPKPLTSRRINFEHPYVTPPKVVVFLNMNDAVGSSVRIKTYASNIDVKGFTIHIDTWADTTIWRAKAAWVAYPEDRSNIFSGTGSTLDLRPWDQPTGQDHKDVKFEGVEFLKQPSVFVALNSVDIGSATNARVRAYVDNVSRAGLTWHCDSWAVTKLWSAGVSYIAFH